MRLLRYILILPFLVYGFAWGYLWYDAYSSLNKLSESAAAFAEVDYDSFFVSPLGNEFTVDGVLIVPQMTPDEFRIEQVRIAADQIGFFLLAGSSLKAGEPPEDLAVNLKNIQLRLDSKLFSLLEKMAVQQPEQTQRASLPFENIDALGCGYVEKFQLNHYRQMGINQINADLNLRMNYNTISEIFKLQLDANTRGIYDINVTADLHVPNGEISGMTQSGKSIPPMQVSINDTGFYKKRNAFCAGANESSVEEYIDKHMQLLSEALGMTLPEQIANAYREHMLNGGRIKISIRPKDHVTGDELAYYKPLEVLDLLGLKLSIGKTRIDIEQLLGGDASMLAQSESKTTGKSSAKEKATKKKAATAQKKEPAANKMDNTARKTEKKTAKKSMSNNAAKETKRESVKVEKTASGPAYHVEKVENAEQYMDKMVEVTLPGDKVRQGVLGQIRNDRIYLIMKLRGGNLTYPVKISEIKKFRVLN